MSVTQHPLHRSVRAALPHTALALGRDDQTLVRVRVAYAWGGQPVSGALVHALPTQMFSLAATTQCAMPQPADLAFDGLYTRLVAGHSEVATMSGHHLRYYAAIRLPASVTHPHAPEGFSMRSVAYTSRRATEGRGISRLPNKVLVRTRGVSGSVTARSSCMPCHWAYARSTHGVAFGVSPPPRHAGPLGPGHGLRSSIPGLHAPLSTLHPHPCGLYTHDSGPL